MFKTKAQNDLPAVESDLRIVAFANDKGGIGKTLLGVNFAIRWAAQGKRVVVIDVDQQAQATWALGAERGQDFYNWMLWEPATGKAPDAQLFEARPNLWVLPGNRMAIAAEVTMATMKRPKSYLQSLIMSSAETNIIQQVKPDLVLIDTPPGGYLREMAIVAASNRGLIVAPTPLREMDADGVMQFAGLVMEFAGEHSTPRVAIVPNRRDQRTKHSDKILTTLCSELAAAQKDDPRFANWTITRPVSEAVDADRAIGEKKALFEYKPDAPATQSFLDVADDLAKHLFS